MFLARWVGFLAAWPSDLDRNFLSRRPWYVFGVTPREYCLLWYIDVDEAAASVASLLGLKFIALITIVDGTKTCARLPRGVLFHLEENAFKRTNSQFGFEFVPRTNCFKALIFVVQYKRKKDEIRIIGDVACLDQLNPNYCL